MKIVIERVIFKLNMHHNKREGKLILWHGRPSHSPLIITPQCCYLMKFTKHPIFHAPLRTLHLNTSKLLLDCIFCVTKTKRAGCRRMSPIPGSEHCVSPPGQPVLTYYKCGYATDRKH